MPRAKRQKIAYEVWDKVCLKCGEIIYKYVATYKDPMLAIELCRWNNRYCIKKLGGDNER